MKVNGKDDIPYIMENKIHVPNHQPVKNHQKLRPWHTRWMIHPPRASCDSFTAWPSELRRSRGITERMYLRSAGFFMGFQGEKSSSIFKSQHVGPWRYMKILYEDYEVSSCRSVWFTEDVPQTCICCPAQELTLATGYAHSPSLNWMSIFPVPWRLALTRGEEDDMKKVRCAMVIRLFHIEDPGIGSCRRWLTVAHSVQDCEGCREEEMHWQVVKNWADVSSSLHPTWTGCGEDCPLERMPWRHPKFPSARRNLLTVGNSRLNSWERSANV